MHNLFHHRRNVLNAQQDITVPDQWMLTMSMCLELTLPCCVLKDTTALQVEYKSAAILTHDVIRCKCM